MSPPDDQTEGTDNRISDVTSVLSGRYEILALLVVIAFMFWTRFRSYANFLTEDGFYLQGVDSYYHWRSTIYTIQEWPNTMPFDPWTSFPTGQRVGQFGTAFDQIIATIALIVGLGDPSEATVVMVVLVMIPLMGALVAVPVYLMGNRLGGRLGGIAGVVLLALFPGSFFSRTAVGQHQHHVAEVLFMAIAVLAFMVALRVAEREKPVFEQVQDRDVQGLQSTLIASALAGTALTAYMWMWPPGVLLVGIVGVYFVVYLSIEHLAGRSAEHVAFVGVISMTVTGILWVATMEEISTSVTGMGYLPAVLAFGVAGGCVVMAWLSREFYGRGIDQLYYPVGVAASIVVALGLMWLVLPDVFSSILSNVQGRLTPIGADISAEVIAEAQPPANFADHAFNEFGLAFYTAIIGLIGLIIGPFLGRTARAEHALIVVWTLFLLSMMSAQVRFSYYLVLPMAVLNAYLMGEIFEWADLTASFDSIRDVEGYQIVTIAVVLMVLVVPLMPPIAGANVVNMSENQFPHPQSTQWESSLDYLEENTPEIGQWGGADESLEYYGTFERPPDLDYQYPEGAYGVMSWWDYGHLITVEGERIPHSNPFQRNARSSAGILLAQGEERGSLMMDALPTGIDVREASDDELRDAVNDRTDQEAGEEMRYIMIDDAMVGDNFGAIANWNEQSTSDFTTMSEVQTLTGEEGQAEVMGEAFDETLMGNLMMQDASGMEQYRLVHESGQMSTLMSVAQVDESGQIQTVMVQSTPQGILQQFHRLGIPFQSIEQIMQHPSFDIYDIQQVPSVKTFERVEGATITGESEAAPGSQVFAMVQLNSSSERSFTYTQSTTVEEDGSFELTVPYATNNELTVEDGYTDSDVYAEDDYSIQVMGEEGNMEQGTTAVPESAVYDGETISVTLEEIEQDENGDNGDAEEDDTEANGGEDTETDTEENNTTEAITVRAR